MPRPSKCSRRVMSGPITRTGSNDDSASVNALVMIKSDLKGLGVRAFDRQCLDRHADFGPELATLRQAAAGQRLPRYASRKSKVILDLRTGARLAPRRLGIQNHHLQSL